MFKLTHINVSRGYRGGERQTELLVRELDSFPIKQTLVARKNQPLSRRLNDLDINIIENNGDPFSVFFASRNSDLIHCHEGRSPYGAYLTKFFLNKPYIVTRRVDNPIRSNIFSHGVYRGASSVVCVANKVASIVNNYDSNVRTEVVHSCGSDLFVNKDNVIKIRNKHIEKFLVGHVGALDNNQKRQEYLISIARDISNDFPDIHFLFVGGGDDESYLRDLSSGLKNITFTGFVDNVGDYLAAFDLFVLPSRREGVGSILIDAMQKSLPIIASDVGGVSEIIKDGINGFLVKEGDIEDIKKKIILLKENKKIRSDMGKRGKKLSENMHSKDMCSKYINIYSKANTKTKFPKVSE